MIESFVGLIVGLPVQFPDPDPIQPPGTEVFSDVLGWAKWLGLAVCIIGIIVAGARMGIARQRGEGGEHMGAVGWALVGVIIIGGAVSLVGFVSGA